MWIKRSKVGTGRTERLPRATARQVWSPKPSRQRPAIQCKSFSFCQQGLPGTLLATVFVKPACKAVTSPARRMFNAVVVPFSICVA